MIDNKKEYILCSAVRLKNEHFTEEDLRVTYKHHSYWDEYGQVDDIYFIETGRRHADILYKNTGRISKNPFDQGFYTSYGRFVSREEAAKIAFECGQIEQETNRLFSEDLY